MLDINYTEGSIVDNASVPVVTASSNATEKGMNSEYKLIYLFFVSSPFNSCSTICSLFFAIF